MTPRMKSLAYNNDQMVKLRGVYPGYTNYDDAYSLTMPSAPALAMKGRDGWNCTSSTPSFPFLRWLVISWTHALVLSMSQKRMEQSWPPDTKEKPAASTDKEVTPSKCAGIEYVHWPGKKLMPKAYIVGKGPTCVDVIYAYIFVLVGGNKKRHRWV
jgi:hypothetical protein